MPQKLHPVSHAPHAAHTPPAAASPGQVLIGVLGWVAALAALGALILVALGGEAKLAKIKQDTLAAQRQKQAEIETRQASLTQAGEKLTADINAEIDSQTKSVHSIQALGKEIAALKSARDANQARADKLKTSVAALGEDLSLMGEGVGELKTKAAQLQQQKQDLIGAYKEKYAAMKTLYEQKLARPEPEMIRQFYGTHQQSPFGPAALFFAAEKLYEHKKSSDAERFYETLVKKYPDSGYVSYAQQRLQTIKDHAPFEKLEGVGLLPYKEMSMSP